MCIRDRVGYDEFKEAVETLELISLTSREYVRKKYLKLSRQYHPDMEQGDTQKFQEVREAYEILTTYMDNFRFVFDENEFKQQNPVLVNAHENWLKGR